MCRNENGESMAAGLIAWSSSSHARWGVDGYLLLWLLDSWGPGIGSGVHLEFLQRELGTPVVFLNGFYISFGTAWIGPLLLAGGAVLWVSCRIQAPALLLLKDASLCSKI